MQFDSGVGEEEDEKFAEGESVVYDQVDADVSTVVARRGRAR